MKRIVIFASGSGTNAENIIRYFKEDGQVEICLVLSNKKDAGVLDRAAKLGVAGMTFDRLAMNSGVVGSLLKALEPDLIVLAGFLWKVPAEITADFPNKIVNIHPALLPAYGGKGMYGMNVHRAVIEDRNKESGITIHYVNENYDEGAVIFQASTPVEGSDTPERLAQKIHQLEYAHFPRIIKQVLDEQ